MTLDIPTAEDLLVWTPARYSARRRWSRFAPALRSGRGLEIRASAPRTPSQPLLWRGYLRFPANRIHKATLEAVTLGLMTFDPIEGSRQPSAELLRFQSSGSRDQLTGTIGFRIPPSAAEQRVQAQSRSLLIKLQYVLWARAIAETDRATDRPVVVSLAQLCEDLGFARLRNGSHRPEHKRQVRAAFELLTSLCVDAEYLAPDRRFTQLVGPLLERHPELETDRTVAFSPGDWHSDPVWARCNGNVGLASAGLLKLRSDRDRWAIAVGGYVTALSRMNGYRPLTLRVDTLLERTGLGTAESRNPARMRDMLERALDRLDAVGIIGAWDWTGAASTEPDMDDADDLSNLAAIALDWRNRSVIVHWPLGLQKRCADLQAAREGHRPSRRRGVRRDGRP